MIGRTLIKYLETYKPKLKPQKIPLPERFEQYITYTEKEAARNGVKSWNPNLKVWIPIMMQPG